MSLFGDFRRVWMERFPESDLPAAWEEDVRSNLLKHRKRVFDLREELEKEEFYVNYLEHLLADVEKQKTRAAGDGEAATEDSSCKTDSSESGIENSDASRKFSKSCSQNSIDLCISELADSAPQHERAVGSPTGTERSVSVDESAKSGGKSLDSRPRSLTQPNLTNFVTVIEINGKAKKKIEVPIKRFPPKPPPKTFARISSEVPKKVEDNAESPQEGKKSADGGSRLMDLEPAQLLKEAAKGIVKSNSAEPLGDSKQQEMRNELSANESVSDLKSQNNLSRLIDRFSMHEVPSKSDNEPPYGRIKRAAPVPDPNQSPIYKETPKSNTGSHDSRKSDKLSSDGRADADVSCEEEEVEYCTLMSPTSEELPSLGSNKEKDGSLEKSKKERLESYGDYEPFYDSVPADDSDNDCVVEGLTLPSRGILRPAVAQGNANYVNIDYFIKQRPSVAQRSSSVDSEEEAAGNDSITDASLLAESISDGTYASNSSLDSSATKLSGSESEPGDMQRKIIKSIIQSEIAYIECLNVLMQYMKALKATLTTSQPVISAEELNTVFYKIPELQQIHTTFLDGLKNQPPYGRHFKTLAENLNDYGAFLHNYGRATDTVKRRCQNSQQFFEITSEIKLKKGQQQVTSLEDLLHKPVARVQKNSLVLDDLLKCPNSSADQEAFRDALQLTKTFLDSFNMIETKKMFGHEDRAQRRLVKNSFMVELVEGHRKLRHLLLFNDVMACAKYKASGRDKFTFDLKWFVQLNDLVIHEETGNEPKEINPPNLLVLKSQACILRDQILKDEEKRRSGLDKQRKKLADLEAQLVLAYPDLVLRVGQRGTRLYCFLLSSEFERTQWIETVTNLQSIYNQSQLPGPKASALSLLELQAWVTACRAFLETNMGSFLMRSEHDESLLRGDLHIRLGQLGGLTFPADLYVVLEVDSYGHYFRKARSKLVCRSMTPHWDQSFVIDLEGSQNLRILVYEEAQDRSILRGKSVVKLSLKWLNAVEVMRMVNVNSGLTLTFHLRFTAAETSVRRIPARSANFGSKIQLVCKREERTIPFVISSCVREVERRGMQEVGIYRVSGSSSEINRLKKAFETNPYEAEQYLKDVCVHSVTNILKLYLRELPEALFTDAAYDRFLEAWNLGEERRGPALFTCFKELPEYCQDIINFLLDHMIRIVNHESDNKMSLHNLATVFGPTLVRPSAKDAKSRDVLAKGTVDVMAQAGILYHFLTAKTNASAR